MYKYVDECCGCGMEFSFDTEKCDMMVIKKKEPFIVFMPRCPHCLCINELKMKWDDHKDFK